MLGDLTKSADIDAGHRHNTRTLGPIDILVHNAGGDIAARGGKPDPNDAVNIAKTTYVLCSTAICSAPS